MLLGLLERPVWPRVNHEMLLYWNEVLKTSSHDVWQYRGQKLTETKNLILSQNEPWAVFNGSVSTANFSWCMQTSIVYWLQFFTSETSKHQVFRRQQPVGPSFTRWLFWYGYTTLHVILVDIFCLPQVFFDEFVYSFWVFFDNLSLISNFVYCAVCKLGLRHCVAKTMIYKLGTTLRFYFTYLQRWLKQASWSVCLLVTWPKPSCVRALGSARSTSPKLRPKTRSLICLHSADYKTVGNDGIIVEACVGSWIYLGNG